MLQKYLVNTLAGSGVEQIRDNQHHPQFLMSSTEEIVEPAEM